jgi:methylenetetrahydrofolate reductase (NADPH)
VQQLEKTLLELEPLHPSFCSVTYGAGGSTRDRTHDAVLHIHRDTKLVAMPHITCVGQTRAEVRAVLEGYRDEGIENILAVAGDPPKDGKGESEFRYAAELIDLCREVGEFSVGVAAFPEVHPRSTDRAADRRHLADKLRAADFGITQFFWTAAHYVRMVDELDALGCATPVLPSLFPVMNVATARRFTDTNGAEWPEWLSARLAAAGDDAEAVRRVGVEVATELGGELLAQDIPGLHIYTLNRAASALEIYAALGLATA